MMVICSLSADNSLMVSVMDSSVKLSSEEVASSKISKCGCLNNALAMDNLCFSPPLNFNPPSPIRVTKPFPPLSQILLQLAFLSAINISSSDALGATNARFSLMVPANNWVSCVTKLIWFLNSPMLISSVFTPFTKI